MEPKVEGGGGVAPRQTSSLWNIGPTGRCFKTNPQHARPLSGANSPNGGVRRCVSTEDHHRPIVVPRRRARVPKRLKRVGERGRSGWSWYLCSAKQTRQGRDAKCGAEEERWIGSK